MKNPFKKQPKNANDAIKNFIDDNPSLAARIESEGMAINHNNVSVMGLPDTCDHLPFTGDVYINGTVVRTVGEYKAYYNKK